MRSSRTLRKLLFVGGAASLVLSSLIPLASGADAAAGTVPLTVDIGSLPGRPASAVAITDIQGSPIATCQEQPTDIVGRTCTVQVPVKSGILVLAEAGPGMRQMLAAGSGCSAAPGPVCHVQIGTRGQRVLEIFGLATPGPKITTARPTVIGHAADCTFGDNDVTVNGSGFLPDSSATLSDDGTVVASGSTDGSGGLSLSYAAISEPGIYRSLVVSAGGQSARTDINSAGGYCYNYSVLAGQVVATVRVTDGDAFATDHLTYPGQVPVGLPLDGSGSGTATTPAWPCPPGTSPTLPLTGTRGAGTPGQYSLTSTIPITC